MNVIVSNKYQNMLATLDIDTSQATLNVEELSTKLSELGLNEEQINSAIDQIAQETQMTLGQEVEIPIKGKLENGEEGVIIDKVTVTSNSVSGLDSLSRTGLTRTELGNAAGNL